MRNPIALAVLAVVVIIVGGALLKGCGDQGSSDPTASVHNGAPRGLLALQLLLASGASGTSPPRIDVVSGFDDPPHIEPGDAVLVTPPERSAWLRAEADALLEAAQRGAHVVIACDDEELRNARLQPLLEAVGVECFRADVVLGDESVTRASGALYGASRDEPLFVRGTGRVRAHGDAPAFAAWTAGADAVVVKRAGLAGVSGGKHGGSITVLGSATILANDGLGRDANAAFALRELAGARVVIDERHHHSRSRAAVLTAAMNGAGPITALLALMLLVPLSLLSLVPRPGDPPRSDEGVHGAPAAEASARALAALLRHARAAAGATRAVEEAVPRKAPPH